MRAGPKAAVTAPPLDLSGLPRRGARRVDGFCREYVRVPKGEGAAGPLRLRRWQLGIVRRLYPGRGPRPRQALLSLPRGNGKSTLAAALGLYGLFADGQTGAQVLVVASDERQAGHVLRMARRMVELDDRLAGQVQEYRDRLYVPGTDSEFRTLPAEPGALQGWDPTLMVVDELHVVDERVWEAVTSAAGKRARSLTFAISTPAENRDSIMWRLVEHGRSGVDPSFVLVEYAAPAGCGVDDRRAWRAANPALGDFLHADGLAATLRTTREASFRRYRLGQWVGQAGAWLPWGAWAGCSDAARTVADGERVVLGFDGSASGDSTALVGATLDGHVFTVDVWSNPGDLAWRVPRGEVDAALSAAFERYEVLELAADPWGWRSELEDWERRYGARRVLEYNTAAASRMGPATDRVYAAVAEGRLTHDGDPRLASHVGNAVVKSGAAGDVLVKDRRGSPRKIDAAVAAVIAYDRAAWHANANPRRRVVTFR